MFLEDLLDIVLDFLDFLLDFGLVFLLFSFLGFLEIEHLAFHEVDEFLENDLNYLSTYVFLGFEIHSGHGAVKLLLNVINFSFEIEFSILETGDGFLN